MVLGLAACSAKDPDPSPLYDGRYVGTRQSDKLDACGISSPHGTTSAQVIDGRLTMPLFSSRTKLDGTVGEDGRVRASGIWRTPTERYPQITVLNGTIRDNVLDGRASDFQCTTDLKLHRILPHHPRNGSS
ncbi:MAG: hypothetical protein ABSC06_09130 [Rhodopila sp.]|jgi:hypothetical protein